MSWVIPLMWDLSDLSFNFFNASYKNSIINHCWWRNNSTQEILTSFSQNFDTLSDLCAIAQAAWITTCQENKCH